MADKSDRVEERARALCEPYILQAGYVIWDVVFEKEGAMRYLRVLFDKEHNLKEESGVTAEECEAVTRILNPVLDKEKFIENVDILEIGSPGLTRRLRNPCHFRSCLGMPLRAAARGEKGKTDVIYGMLKEFNETDMIIGLETAPENNKDKTGGKDKPEITALEIKKCVRINLDL